MTISEVRRPEAVAIVGFAFRLPGAQGDTLWECLLAGRDLVATVEASRWAQEPYLHPRKSEPGSSYTFAAGSVGDVAGFDAAFFGISPREAEQMDPQQRVLLEMTWEAFEQAGIPPSSMRGRRCGVYVGLSSVDYSYRRADDMASIDATTMTGNAGSIAANRISYVFDLRGPSMAVDTACSSSLVALHQACQSLHSGETDAAVVGGISLHLHPYAFIGFSKASMLSRQGRCAAFAEDGDGYVRSEGGAIVLLKPLAQALADGNRILALVAQTGVNSDGRKVGLTVPSHTAQAQLLREVYESAGIAPAEIDYFEAHGTGTAVGDPIEARAVGEAIGQLRPAGQPLPIGSIKSNVGHLEAAAGMAGLVKALHVLRYRRVPPNIHLDAPNPNIDFAGLNLAPVAAPLELDAGRRLVVGVSAFGFGGTNAHAVLTSHEGAGHATVGPVLSPALLPREHGRGAEGNGVSMPPLMLSARTPEALRASASGMAEFLRARGELAYYDIAYSAARHREIHLHRLSAAGKDRQAVAEALERFARTGTAGAGVVVGSHRPGAAAPAFVYSGNGSQWPGMGLQLLERDATFRAAVEEVDALFAAHSASSILAALRADPGERLYDHTEAAQPALFAVQVGLTRMLERQGVRPVAVCGHSVGEVAAAWASGALTLEQAVHVIHERSAHQSRTHGRGCMSVVALGESDTVAVLTSFALGDRLSIAALNSAGSVTVAGDEEAMARFEAALAQRRVAWRRLDLAYAFHSAAMDPIRESLVRSLEGLAMQPGAIAWYSTVTGARVASDAPLGAEYWWHNVRQPVRFDTAIGAMLEDAVDSFIEIGPRAILSGYLNEIVKHSGREALVIPSLQRNEADYVRMQWLVQRLELSGILRDPRRLFPVPGRFVDLPHYPWQREPFWHPSTVESLGLLQRRIVHPLLGYALAGEALHWENHLDTERLPMYADHAMGGAAVFPAAGFVEMALAAAQARRGQQRSLARAGYVIEDLEILAPLLLEADRSRVVRLRVEPADGRFTIVSRDRAHDDPWRLHATGRLVDDCVPASAAAIEMPGRAPDVEAGAHYALACSLGLDYGPAFRSVAGAWRCAGAIVGAIAPPHGLDMQDAATLLHPAYLDGAFQLLADLDPRERDGAIFPEGAAASGQLAFLPVRIERLDLLQPHARVAAARLVPGAVRHRSRRSMLADFTLADAAGALVAVARGVRFRAANLQHASARAPSLIATRGVAMPRRGGQAPAVLPPLEELARRCTQRLHAPWRVDGRLRFSQEVEPLLDALCASFAERALRELAAEHGASAALYPRGATAVEPAIGTGDGPAPALGKDAAIEAHGVSAFDPHAWIASGRVPADSAPRLANLLQVLLEDGVVQPVDTGWQWQVEAGAERGLPAAEDIWRSLIADYPEYAALMARVGSAGLHLAEHLRGSARQSGGPAAQRGTTSAMAWADGCTQQEAAEVAGALAGILERAVAIQPVYARLRVLRLIGALPPEGQEGKLLALPGIDPDRCELIIGARSQDVLDDLRGRWPAMAALAAQVVDLDRLDPAALERLGGRFHVLVLGEGLTEILARAPDPARRLGKLHELLGDQGLLVALEQHPSRACDLLFGGDPGWWRVGADGRAGTGAASLMEPEDWMRDLTRAGFDEVQTVADAPGTATGPYLLLARADHHADAPAQRELNSDSTREQLPAAVRTWLLIQDEAGYPADLGAALGAQLARRGQGVVVVVVAANYSWNGQDRFALDPSAAGHWDRLIADLRRSGREPNAWVHLAGLDLASGGAPPLQRAGALEARAGVLMAWLQACSRNTLRPDCWVVGVQAGLALLPSGAQLSGTADGRVAPDRLRDAALWGLTRVAAQEFADLHLRWVDLADPLPCGANAVRLIEELLEPDTEDEILLTAEGRYVPRVGIAKPRAIGVADNAPAPGVERGAARSAGATRHPGVQLDFSVPGPFRNLLWTPQAGLDAVPGTGEVEIEVRAAGLNFRDVMYAMGMLPDEAVEDGFCGPTLGMELSGVVTRVGPDVGDLAPGDAVMAFAPASFATRVRTQALAVTRKPPRWSFPAAATVPTAFFTAYYALVELAHLREGERVLIHGAAGGVGIAAIQLARHLGAEVFATAGTPAKRDFVRLLGADHVFSSRSLVFGDEILQATGGSGVDVILNSLAGEALERNLRLLRPFGRMLELGKRDFYENSRVGLRPFRNNVAYFGIDADQLLVQRPDIARRVFVDLMALFADGSLRPLPHESFCASDIASAFRHMQASHHIGKVVVSFPAHFDPIGPLQAPQPSTVLRRDATYLVTGGLSGFGLRTAQWLVRHGARHLALLGRRGAGTPAAEEALGQFAAAGVAVEAIACDVADPAAVSAALGRIGARMPPLRGIVHSAMVIDDALIREMDRGQLHEVLAPKILGALHLHELTRRRPLDFFVLYSSATTIFGNPGQGAYVAANMALEALAAERRALGLPATCIAWGPIGDAGYLARNERVRDALVGRMGGHALSADAALGALDRLLGASTANVALLDLDWNVLARHLPAARAPRFGELARMAESASPDREAGGDLRQWLETLPAAELVSTLADIVRGEIAQILRIAPERIEATASLFDMGMDSLMAVELAASIEGRLGIELSALSLSDGPTIERVVERIVRQLHTGDEITAQGSENELAERVRAVTARHASELGAEFATELGAYLHNAPGAARTLTGTAKP